MKGISFFLGCGMAMLYPLHFNRYGIEPKGFLIYLERGIAHALSNFKHEQYHYAWTKIIQPMMFTKYSHEGIVFLLDFGMVMQYPSRFQ
jgi:hypothetical protein